MAEVAFVIDMFLAFWSIASVGYGKGGPERNDVSSLYDPA
jgi:hypothetical protein